MNVFSTDIPNPAQGQAVPSYSLDLSYQEAHGRSLEVLLRSRLCSSCRAGESRPRGRKASDVANWGRDELLAQIRVCCSRKETYINARTPVVEAAFRLLLSKGGPMTLEEVATQLAQRRGVLATESLKGLLDKLMGQDSFYGFQRLPPDKAGS